VPQALLNRPNLVTKAALVEEAYSLSKHELDQLDKYDSVFGESQNASFSDRLHALEPDQKSRILRHHAKIIAAKHSNKLTSVATGTGRPNVSVSVAPSPQLVAALRHVYGGEESHVLMSLLQSVMDHPVFSRDEVPGDPEDSEVDDSPPVTHQLESIISRLCHDQESLPGMLISIISLLTSLNPAPAIQDPSSPQAKKTTEESDPIPMPALQVGSLLKILRPEEDDKGAWNVDTDLIAYLGEAASAYEERIDIQKSRLLNKDKQIPSINPPQTPLGPQSSATPDTPDAINIHIPHVDEAAAALSAAVFEQMISAASGEETSSNDDENENEIVDNSSDSESDREDSPYDQSTRRALENESSSSSSSSSSSDAEPEDTHEQRDEQHVDSEDDAENDEEDDDDDEDLVLRQALALSLVEQTASIRVNTSSSEPAYVAPSESLSSGPVTPRAGTPTPVKEAAISELKDSPLPKLPTPPKFYPFTSMFNSDHDDEPLFMDPAALHRFGSVPTQHVLMHLLRYTLERIERRKFQASDEPSSPRKNTSTISGGIGSSLFPPTLRKPKANDQGSDAPVSLQLLVALFLLSVDKRNDAIENLRKALAQESRAATDGEEGQVASSPSEEGDDPAIALALNHLDEDEISESLQAKGMRRKAAAAAHDAAALTKSLRRRTDAWKQRVKLFSQSALVSMKCLRLFLQSVVRQWLQERRGLSAIDCHDFLPIAVALKLSKCLAALTSVSSNSSLNLLPDESDELLMPLRLYQEAQLLWGESVPLLYPSVGAQVEILRSLLTECSKSSARVHSLENLTSPHCHRLEMVCRRLRVSDLLDSFVSSPACYLPDADENDEMNGEANKEALMSSSEPYRASSVVAMIRSSSQGLGGIKGELQHLFLALCHRIHLRILLWDGLFASAEPETDEAAVSLTPSPGDSVRVSSTPSSTLQLDATKCSDSIAIISNNENSSSITPIGSSGHQRASKVWGTVLSSACYSPKTGVHRWAIRLDKCERGHVFVGVSTAQASMRTYVGGDKYGWGMIGTQALWHDRRKIRGDYGATFRTGSTIIITLDTDAGTLSFSSWKDGNSSSSFSLDPLVQNSSSPRRQGHVGGTIEEWGVAFEGLPLDSRLYPAVGLYQRDDRVTFLTVESGGRATLRNSSIDVSGGVCYYPRISMAGKCRNAVAHLAQVRKFNDRLSWDGIDYASKALEDVVDCIREGRDDFLLTALLPSLASSLCLVPPTIPMLSQRCALTLLPHLTKCVRELERCRAERPMVNGLFRTGLQEGKWTIRATGSSGSSSDSEEYVVDFSVTTNKHGSAIGFEGSGVGTTGKSKNGLVAIFGTLKGSSLHFVEEWTDGNDDGFTSVTTDDSASSCVVNARLSLYGTKFEGTYRNVQFGTTGQIAGLLCSDINAISKFRLKDVPASSKQSAELTGAVVAGEGLLCLSHSHMATIVGEDAAGDLSYDHDKPANSPLKDSEWPSHRTSLKQCLSLPVLTGMSVASHREALPKHLDSLRVLFAPPSSVRSGAVDHLCLLNSSPFQEEFGPSDSRMDGRSFLPEVEIQVAKLDEEVCSLVGGKGSLSTLNPPTYLSTRQSLICSLLHHCGLSEVLRSADNADSIPTELLSVWRAASRILEDGVRNALSAGKRETSSREKCATLCNLYDLICNFLLSLERSEESVPTFDDVAIAFSFLFSTIKCEGDLEYLRTEKTRSTKRAMMRLIAMHETITLLSDSSGLPAVKSTVAIESLAIGIPRLLGRGYSQRVRKHDSQRSGGQVEDLGGHYLTGIFGSDILLKRALKKNAHELLHILVRVVERAMTRRKQNNSSESVISIDSMILSLLGTFIIVLRGEEVHEFVRSTPLLSVITQILNEHRHAVLGNLLDPGDHEVERVGSVVKDLYKISDREVSRSVLRAAVAVAHVTLYQVSAPSKSRSSDPITLSLSSDLLLDELAATLPLIEAAVVETLSEYEKKCSDNEWDNWCDLSMQPESLKTPTKPKVLKEQVGKSGVKYLEEHGTTQINGVQASTQKQSSRSRGNSNSSPRSGTENLIKLQGNFCHQYLSHWLHVFVAVSRDPAFLANMAADIRWTKLLLSSVGLSAEFGSTNNVVKVQVREQAEGLLPGRYRSRVIRSLLPLLDAMTPCKEIVRGFFCLAGATSPSLSQTMDEDEGTVSREAVSLLRQLHSPSRSGWRQCINEVVTGLSSTPSKDPESMPFKIGALCFFNGNVDVISRGSFVLLKPASAVPLSVDQQSTPNSKGQSSSVGGGSGSGIGSTPHHIVGSGTGGIVSGLCRADASAGIVSSVDMQNGVCEVILLTRNRGAFEGADEDDDSSRARPAVSSGKGSHSSKHTLTVRALRSPLADVVQAQEVPIYLDESIGVEKLVRTALEDALRILSAARFDSSLNERYNSTGETATEMEAPSEDVQSEPGGDEAEMNIAEMRSKITDVASAVLAVRSSIVILSDEKILMQFVKDSNSRELLSAVLELACPDDKPAEAKQDYAQGAQKKFLSSLPVHEAKWVHLVALFRDLRLREHILLATPESLWNKRLTEYRSKQSEMTDLETASAPILGGQVGSISHPADSSFVAEAPPVSTNSGNSEGGMSRTADSNLNHGILQSSAGSDNSEEEDDSEAAATAATHLREAAIAQMAELGLPRSWSELALRRTGGTNIEAAVHFCLERGGEMERLLAEERERESIMQRQASSGSSGRRRADRSESGPSNHLLRQLLEMGFPSRWCAEALAANGNNVDAALTWILTNGERLSAEDEGMEEDDDEEDIDDDEEDEDSQDDDETADGRAASDTVPKVDAAFNSGDNATHGVSKQEVSGTVESSERPGWSGSAIPLRFISGRSMIDPRTLAISGLPTGGFSSVGTKGIMLTSGKWYYEAILETAGCLQIGWADGSFAGHCHADRGDGCGDGPSSWAYDGWRRYRWHATATEWGCRWKEGDVVGCLVDMDDPKSLSFTLNGRAEDVGMGVAFSGNGFRPCGGVYACVSFNRREKLRLILGGIGSESFKYPPPPGYCGVGEAVLQAVEERDVLILKESPLDQSFSANMLGSSSVQDLEENCDESKRFLCDFSDGEHGHELMAWAHRYYGSDASVHLGSGRMKQSSGISKRLPSSSSVESSPSSCLSRRVEKVWSRMREGKVPTPEDASDEAFSVSMMKCGYTEVGLQIAQEIFRESMAMASLLARKLILHTVVSMGEDFDPDCYFRSENPDLLGALRFWKVVEASSSLRCAGWVGEAGAMALAAEALGLGISSNDHTNSRHASSERSGVASLSDLDDGLLVPAGGITQLLSSVLEWDMQTDARSSGNSLAASAEAAIGSDGGGGVLVFLLKGLQGAACRSEPFRRIIIAAVRRTVRLLAVVEYDGDDSASAEAGGDEDDDTERKLSSLDRSPTSRREDEIEEKDTSAHADARLASFLTGLLLSKPVETAVGDLREIEEELFEVWSVGMLSASLPWRMVCAFTAAGILNRRPSALCRVVDCFPTIARFYGRLQSTVVRRVWAERAAVPVCSRYVQSMIELLTSVKRAVDEDSFSDTFLKAWNTTCVDAATPLPLGLLPGSVSNWEADEGWLSSDCGWEVWTGTVEYMAVDWKTPSRSAVRTLMDGGDGPPMLREGCTVMRGLDWEEDVNNGNADGKDIYEAEKAERDSEKRASEETFDEEPVNASEAAESIGSDDAPTHLPDPTDEVHEHPASVTTPVPEAGIADEDKARENASAKKKKRKKVSSPKLPLGTVISIERWNGIPAMGRRVRWHLTGKEGVYRYGGDGGRYDISHIEVNEKATRVRKRHPLPESAEQCAARHGFGAVRRHNVLLRLRRNGSKKNVNGTAENHRQAILEWPDFGAGVLADCTLHSDGAVTLHERELIFGSKDSGWEARFGQPSYVPGTIVNLRSTESCFSKTQAEVDRMSPYQSFYDELVGSNSFDVQYLRNRENGSTLQVTSEMRLFRGKAAVSEQGAAASATSIQAPLPPPIHFDRDYHASSLSLSRDGRTVSCVSSDGRGTAFASVGFTKGVHYWEVKLEQADIGSVFIGVAEKPSGSGGSGSSFGYDSPPRLNRWHGWGFVNFRATYTAGAERVYGAHCHAGDTVGVMLDCDAGRISFFFDGLKYGEHILNDLGCAFENISPFGFNVDGCGSGGAGQGAPSGIEGGRGGRYPAQGSVRPRALWPVVGLRNHGDRVTISSKWSTSYGVDGLFTVKNVLAVDELLNRYSKTGGNIAPSESPERSTPFPEWFVLEAFSEYQRWQSGSWCRSTTRGSGPYDLTCFGPDLELDSSPFACASACAMLGLKHALLAGDRVRLKRSAGRILELAEEAVVLGIYQGRLFYRIVSQKSEGGSLTEGGGRAWCWDESEVVDGLPPLTAAKGLGIELSLLDRFKCTSSGGLRVVYEGGAVVRSDLEIFDGSINLGSIPVKTVLAQKDVLERRINSCGVVRYRVRYDAVGEGWISSCIRGGKEEAIVMPIHDSLSCGDDQEPSFSTPHQCAVEWLEKYNQELLKQGLNNNQSNFAKDTTIEDIKTFEYLVASGVIPGLSIAESDSLLTTIVGAISAYSEAGDEVDASFHEIASAISFGLASKSGQTISESHGSPGANQAAATALAGLETTLPPLRSILARVAVIRSFNKRARLALPWLPLRPSQEGAAILGGLYGHGASIDRAGRNRLPESQSQWLQVPSIASSIRSMRGLFFTGVKRGLLQSITEATTTPTPLSHDEYELPREIRTVRINRLKARRALSGVDVAMQRKHSVFAQLHNETKGWGGAALRRGFVAKGHGGQKRSFKVKLIGEGVNDYSGPYREAFTDAMSEILNVDKNSRGSLGVLDPTPNNSSEIGENRDLFMFSLNGRDLSGLVKNNAYLSVEEHRIRESFSSLTTVRDETSREVEEALVFLGRMTGTAFRHGIPLDLPLPMESMWKAMAEEPSKSEARLNELDCLAQRQRGVDGNGNLPPILWWQQRMLNSFVEGLSNVLPVEVLTIFTGEELRDIFCGNPEVDVDLLRRVVEYEGYNESDDVIQYFWETLRELTNDERKTFLQFVWARNRLPTKESDFDAPFKIQRDGSNNRGDNALPSASTCFFSLALPEYSSKEVLKHKLLFAINNVTTMETDFQTNSAEIAEGYRAF
jgi:hypothetical protein